VESDESWRIFDESWQPIRKPEQHNLKQTTYVKFDGHLPLSSRDWRHLARKE
jgi:hypothetical protein